MKHEDGGPAFPGWDESVSAYRGDSGHPAFVGMSLRDWFAGHAAAALTGSVNYEDLKGPIGKMTNAQRAEMFAKDAYAIADALLKARQA